MNADDSDESDNDPGPPGQPQQPGRRLPRRRRDGREIQETAARKAVRKMMVDARAVQAVQLRRDGKSLEWIATELGMTATGVQSAIKRTLERTAREPIEAVRALEVQRLDELYEMALNVAKGQHYLIQQGAVVRQWFDLDGNALPQGPILTEHGTPDYARCLWRPVMDSAPVLAAIDRALKIQQRRATLLGLDKQPPTPLLAADGTPLLPSGNGGLPTIALHVHFVDANEGRPAQSGPAEPLTVEGEATERTPDP
jgi:hypothetical protein